MTTYGSGLAGLALSAAVDGDGADGMERFRAEMSLMVSVPRGERSELDDDDADDVVTALVGADIEVAALVPPPELILPDGVSVDPACACCPCDCCCTFSTPSSSNLVDNPLFPLAPEPVAVVVAVPAGTSSCLDNALLIFGGSLRPKPPV
jgi:hypothetical protein